MFKSKVVNYALLSLAALMILRSSNMSEPIGIRNNNPLNIRSNDVEWLGKVGEKNGFVVFDSAVNGIRAAARLMRTYRDKYELTTISGIVSKWAPPVENDTNAYIDGVSKKTGIQSNAQLYESDYLGVIDAMIYHENGKQPYSLQEIKQGFEMGFLA